MSYFNICFAADEGYVKYVAVLIKSIIDNFETNTLKGIKKSGNKELPVHFHILTNEIKKETVVKLNGFIKSFEYPCELYIHTFNNGDAFFAEKGIKPWARGGYMCNYRFFLSDIFEKEKNVLYMDVDTLVFSDLRKLWEMDLKNRIVGAVNDQWLVKLSFFKKALDKNEKMSDNLRDLAKLHRYRKNKKTKENIFLFDKERYFNSGVLFLDIQRFKEKNVKEKCFEFLEKFETYMPDQDALNYAIPEDEVLWLPMEYNFEKGYLLDSDKRLFSYLKNPNLKNPFEIHNIEGYKEAVKNIQIVHFIGKRKPWHKEKGGKAQKYWIETAKQTPWWDEIQKGIEEEKLKRKKKNEKIAKNATKTTSLDRFM